MKTGGQGCQVYVNLTQYSRFVACVIDSSLGFMVNNHPTQGQGWLLYTINPRLTCTMCYILQPDWSLLLLVNIQGSLHCKQGMLSVNMQGSLHCKQGSL